MAKNKQSKSNKGNGNQKADHRGSVTQSIKDTEIGRATKRQARLFQERLRANDRDGGTFYTRVNAERSNDLSAAVNGVVGSYAWPGDNQPSVHFNVQPEIGKQGSMPVIRLESIQYGHELEGEVFDQKIFLPCFYIGKFGQNFQSRLEERLSARTQELICHYMANQLGYGSVTDFDEQPEDTFQEVFARASTDLKMMLQGIVGQYGMTTERGQVILEVFAGKRANLQVIDSTDGQLSAGRVFIPVHCLFYKTLDQVTDNDRYQEQLKIWTFVQNELGNMIAEVKADSTKERQALREDLLNLHGLAITAASAVTNALADSSKKSEKKQAVKMARKIEKANEDHADMVALENMRKHAIDLRHAASGKMGYVSMTGSSGELIVLFGQVGVDKVIQVVHLTNTHMLHLAGVDVGTKIYLGQLLQGEIDHIDMANHKLSAMQMKSGNALIAHIRDRLADAGVKLHSTRTNLRLIKKAA